MATPEITQEDFFIQIYNDTVFDTRLSASAFRVLCILLTYAGSKDVCWPGQKAIADKAGLKVRQVYNLLHKLEEVGLIKQEFRLGDTSKYYILCKVIHRVIPKVFNRQELARGGRQGNTDKSYSTNNNHFKGGYPPSNKNKNRGEIPGWVKKGGIWVEVDAKQA